MNLKFIFNVASRNGIIQKSVLKVAKRVNSKVGIKEDLDKIEVYVDGNLEEFSRELSKVLPLSIFLESLKAEVTEDFIEEEIKYDDVEMPPCLECIEKAKESFNIFQKCEVCGYHLEGENRSYENEIKELANKLKDGSIFIDTFNGSFEISTHLDDAEFLVARDLGVVGKYFFSFSEDAKALASIEKPFLRLKTNLEFKKKFSYNSSYLVKLPDDLLLELLFYVSDFEILGFKKAKAKDFILNKDYTYLPIAVMSEGKVLLEKGKRGICNKSCSFEEVFKEWRLNEKSIVSFIFNKNSQKILLTSSKLNVEYIDFSLNINSMQEVFSEIRRDETGKKLFENYYKKYPNIVDKLIDKEIKVNNLYDLFGVIGLILGFADDIESARDKLIQNANDAVTKKGPRIDYRFKDQKLDYIWSVRTAMSFKLAGVDEYLLSYGIIESLAEKLSNIYDTLEKEQNLDGALLIGDMFEGEFLSKVYGYIAKNYKVYLPRGMAIECKN